jgi:5-methylcytosine-specific restriction endonuclease McrA
LIREDGCKQCYGCKEWKPVAEFYKNNTPRSDGYSSYCKPCEKVRVVKNQKANPAMKARADKKQNQKPERKRKHNERTKRRRDQMMQTNPAALKAIEAERNRLYNERHPERRAEIGKRWREAHPEESKASQRKHYWEGEGRRDRCRDHTKLRHAFNREKVYNDDAIKLCRQDWLDILAAFDNKCCYCDSPDDLTIEHLTPLRRGGKSEIGNLAPACRECNLKKNAKMLETFSPDRALEIRHKAFLGR